MAAPVKSLPFPEIMMLPTVLVCVGLGSGFLHICQINPPKLISAVKALIMKTDHSFFSKKSKYPDKTKPARNRIKKITIKTYFPILHTIYKNICHKSKQNNLIKKYLK